MIKRWLAAVLALAVIGPVQAETSSIPASALAKRLEVGDVVFIRVTAGPFRRVASATNSWTNHVGIVTAVSGDEAEISESTFPFSRATMLSKFVKRSENGRIEVRRLNRPLTRVEQARIVTAARARYGIHY